MHLKYYSNFLFFVVVVDNIRLSSLQFLSVDDNELERVPMELCACSQLAQLHLANNKLENLPLEFGFLTNLEKLYLQKNKLKELPEVYINLYMLLYCLYYQILMLYYFYQQSIGKCYKLRVLDIAANELRIFPTEVAFCSNYGYIII